jgi:hypothetical protein
MDQTRATFMVHKIQNVHIIIETRMKRWDDVVL